MVFFLEGIEKPLSPTGRMRMTFLQIFNGGLNGFLRLDLRFFHDVDSVRVDFRRN